jgi:membrane associated rhomboid family serine protease
MIGSWGDPPEKDPDDYPYKRVAAASVIGGVIQLTYLGLHIFGLTAVVSFHPRNCRVYWIVEAVLAVITCLNSLIIGRNYFGAVVGLGFSVWWVIAIKSLADRKQLLTLTHQPSCLPRTAAALV